MMTSECFHSAASVCLLLLYDDLFHISSHEKMQQIGKEETGVREGKKYNERQKEKNKRVINQCCMTQNQEQFLAQFVRY